jgi:hypothetical protein
VSERNGDKARYQRERKRKILHRTRIRELREALEGKKAVKGEPAPRLGIPTVIH